MGDENTNSTSSNSVDCSRVLALYGSSNRRHRRGDERVKMDKVANSGNDEFYTPSYAVIPIIKYIPKDSTVWCPFDQPQSWFVRELSNNGIEYIASHIEDDKDFFKEPVPIGVTHIISNPPYSLKGDVLQRLFELGIPFAMLVGVVGLFESEKRFQMFKANEFEIMYLNRKVAYFKSYEEQKPSLNPPFSSVYLCKGMLPKQIIFEEIQKK